MFITLEGGDGVGKSTQARLLAEALRRDGHEVLLTREPGGTPGAEALRALLLSPEHDWCDLTEILLHFAARSEHVTRVIRPALDAGLIVVCDRFTDSTLAYQGYGAGGDPAVIAALSGMIALRPRLTLVLEVPPEVAALRRAARGGAGDRYEALGADFHRRVVAGFRAIAAAEPERCVIVPGDGTPESVHAAIWAAVTGRLAS